MGGCGGEDENKLVRVGIVEIKVMCMRLKISSCNRFFRDLPVMIYAMSTSFHPPSSSFYASERDLVTTRLSSHFHKWTGR